MSCALPLYRSFTFRPYALAYSGKLTPSAWACCKCSNTCCSRSLNPSVAISASMCPSMARIFCLPHRSVNVCRADAYLGCQSGTQREGPRQSPASQQQGRALSARQSTHGVPGKSVTVNYADPSRPSARSSSLFPSMSTPSCPSHRHCDRYGILAKLGVTYVQQEPFKIDVRTRQSGGFRYP